MKRDRTAYMATRHQGRKPAHRAYKRSRAALAHQESPEAVREVWRAQRAARRRKQAERLAATAGVSFFELAGS